MTDEQTPEQQLTPEQYQQAQEQMQFLMKQLGGLLMAVAPHLPQNELMQILSMVIEQETELHEVIDDALNPKSSARSEYPFWGVKVHNKGGVLVGKEGTIVVPKDAARCENISELMQYVSLFGLVSNPVQRGIFAAYGMTLEFFQSPNRPGSIILPV